MARPKRTEVSKDVEERAAALAHKPSTPPATQTSPSTPRTGETNTTTITEMEVDKSIPNTGQQIASNKSSWEDIQRSMICDCLIWMGFHVHTQVISITNNSFSTFDDIRIMKPEDIDTMMKDNATRTERSGKFIFGVKRYKLLQAFVHWTQDFYRVSLTPTLKGLNKESFLSELRTALV